ncbi:MAG: type III pantothenate kinase [Breznakia sp.]
MLVTIDIGNTNITLALFKQDKLIATYRLTTKLQRTSDEYGFVLVNFLQSENLYIEEIDDVIVASVVPKIMHSFNNALRKYLKKEPITIGPGIKTGISIKIDNPRSLGADRIVDAAGAHYLYGDELIVIDFGTATTFDVVNAKGEFVGGVTSPGLEISAQALSKETAKLPEVAIQVPNKAIATNTIDSMQAGIFYGYLGHTEYIIQKLKAEIAKPTKVIATGGLGRIIAENTSLIDVYDPDLAFKGLHIIYQKNKKRSTSHEN